MLPDLETKPFFACRKKKQYSFFTVSEKSLGQLGTRLAGDSRSRAETKAIFSQDLHNDLCLPSTAARVSIAQPPN